MMLWGTPDGLGSCCQISSVMKGMKGCSRRMAVSSAVTSAPWILARATASSPARANPALASSMYQSQTSFQMKW